MVAAAIALGAGGGAGAGRGKPARAAGTRGGADREPAPVPERTRLARIESRGIARIRSLARLGLPVYCAGPRGHEVAFTFDDGPGPYTYLALRKLKRAHERATFFVVGRSMDNFPGRLGREREVGEIGDHTYHHLVLTELPPAVIRSEILSTEEKIERLLKAPVFLFRPPYGARNPVVDRVARRLGLLEILWDVDSADSLGANWAGIIRNVEAGLRPGAIILMHENRGQTIRALTTLLPVLRRRGLRSVSLPELFATDPPSVAQLRKGYRGCTPGRPARTGA